MQDLLNSKHTRRLFFVIVILFLLVILLVRYFLIPYFVEPNSTFLSISNSILDNLFASVIATIVIGSFLFWVSPVELKENVKIISSYKIGELLDKARFKADFWYFSGGTGSYTRTVTIPTLAKNSREENRHKVIKLQIINPLNTELCEKYCQYRKSLKSGSKQNRWYVENLRRELLSTIIIGYIWKTKQPLVEFSVGLKDSFSLFRFDISSSSAIITKENKEEPAILCELDTFLYNSYKEEFLQSFKQCNVLPSNILLDYEYSELTLQIVKTFLASLGWENLFTDEDVNETIEIIKKNFNPYK